MERLKPLLFVLMLLLGMVALADQPRPAGRFAALLTIDGPIGPATSDYFTNSLHSAVERGAALVILEMDTPGGLDSSMRQIIKTILASPVPVVGYVAPRGARAASAGTYILYACHIAAMAPATNLGAATPVSLGPMPGSDEGNARRGKASDEYTPSSPEMRKVLNDAVAYIRGLAHLRGRNADWAEAAVRRAVSLEAQEAVRLNVVDLMADNIPALLKAIDGRQVSVNGAPQILSTANLSVVNFKPGWRSQFLSVITNPNIAYILLLIGIYGLILEFAHPGTFAPGVLGAICLVLGLFALQMLPINYAGLALMLLGVALMVAEVFVPSFGALGIGGVAALVIGSLILINTEAPGFGISRGLIGGVALFSGALFLFLMSAIAKARRRPVVSGREEMIGSKAFVLDDFDKEGLVRAHSELWRATTDTPLHKGQTVRIVGLDGLCLKVTPIEQETNS